jgi:hypothetical protein
MMVLVRWCVVARCHALGEERRHGCGWRRLQVPLQRLIVLVRHSAHNTKRGLKLRKNRKKKKRAATRSSSQQDKKLQLKKVREQATSLQKQPSNDLQ